ncbi:hypothetical protein J3998_12370 [Thiomicrorhabdus sp. 6S2-11]|uniref:Uncharacterized protein n=1 Tax=Thiomicrorhabdus marina TaxID=2818442 RepID=A0ABS3Q8A7_9GAMM|nr:hypothetical protein [Thiomicrorhabdus marina]MBO1928368.1 hypothetical protein [Thiomicrorhabdus marina]
MRDLLGVSLDFFNFLMEGGIFIIYYHFYYPIGICFFYIIDFFVILLINLDSSVSAITPETRNRKEAGFFISNQPVSVISATPVLFFYPTIFCLCDDDAYRVKKIDYA